MIHTYNMLRGLAVCSSLLLAGAYISTRAGLLRIPGTRPAVATPVDESVKTPAINASNSRFTLDYALTPSGSKSNNRFKDVFDLEFDRPAPIVPKPARVVIMAGSKSATLSFYEITPDWNYVPVTPGMHTLDDIKKLLSTSLPPVEDNSVSIPTFPPPAAKKEAQKGERTILPGSKVWYMATPSDVRALFNNPTSEPGSAPASSNKDMTETMERLEKKIKALEELESLKKSSDNK